MVGIVASPLLAEWACDGRYGELPKRLQVRYEMGDFETNSCFVCAILTMGLRC
jgi:hypothetical protein